MFSIIASDLDGTLLSPKHQLTDFTKRILRLVTSVYGVHFVFATGRHHINTIQIRDSLNIGGYMITSNGSRIHNIFGELVCSHNLDAIVVSDLLHLVHKDDKILINLFSDNRWFVNRERMDHEGFFREFSFTYEVYQEDRLPVDDICKVYFTSVDSQRLSMLEKFLKQRWSRYINVSFSLSTCLEIMPAGVSKGHALQQVANLLGYRLQDCISFGDGMNDYEMLSMSGKGCIMGNANQRLKDALPFLEVIGSNREDAVSHYLQALFFLGQT